MVPALPAGAYCRDPGEPPQGEGSMRLLIYGAGVIGSLYAVLFSEAGYDTSVYARGERLKVLKNKGLLYLDHKKVRRVKVRVLEKLQPEDVYDFIFLTVRKEQLYQALEELKGNKSGCIVTMVNALDDYGKWEAVCGRGRILPAFPGGGGGIHGDVLKGALVPGFVQPTTFGEIAGIKSERAKDLAGIFQRAGIPCQQVRDMRLWQLCHLALVVPLADAYYEAKDPQRAGRERELMEKTARRLKRNFCFIKKHRGKLSPGKMHLFRFVPVPLLALALGCLYQSSFGDTFMYQHAMKAKEEMGRLHEAFYGYIRA